MVEEKTDEKKKSRRFAYFAIVIISLTTFGYALQYFQTAETQAIVHRHASISIEGINIKSLKHAEDFDVHFIIHLHRENTSPILHMEGKPTPIKEFFNSISFNTSEYYIVVYPTNKEGLKSMNGKIVSFDYIFQDNDEIILRKSR